MSVQTINEVFYKVVERSHDRVMLFKQTVKWIPIASHELYRDAVGVSHQLQQWGVQKGDRVAILSENRPEWTVAEFGTVLIGIWLLLAARMKPLPAVKNLMVHIPDLSAEEARRLEQQIAAVTGVTEVAVATEEGAAYVKVDSRRLDEAALRALLPSV